MARIGDDAAGFVVEFDSTAGTVRVRAWGFWSRETAESFDLVVSEVCRTTPRGTPVAMDMRELKPLREEGQMAFGKLVRSLRTLGIPGTRIATSSHLTKLQLLRLAAEHGMRDFIEFTSGDASTTATGEVQKAGTQQ